MPAMNPSKDAMSIVMVQFSPEAATTRETVDRNIKKIEEYVTRATNGFPGVDLIVFPEYSTHGFGFDPYANHFKIAETINDTYIKISNDFKDCEFFSNWLKK